MAASCRSRLAWVQYSTVTAKPSATSCVATMARVLGVSRTGYYAWASCPASVHAETDTALLERIRTVHAASRETYGAPRVHADLRAGGERHGRKRIARLMRGAGIKGVSRRRGGPVTTRMMVESDLHPTSWTATSLPLVRTVCG